MATLTDVLTPLPWHYRSACHGHEPELWWADSDRPRAQAAALEICRGCPVKHDCLQAALTGNETEGIWGGLLPYQRKGLKAYLDREDVA